MPCVTCWIRGCAAIASRDSTKREATMRVMKTLDGAGALGLVLSAYPAAGQEMEPPKYGGTVEIVTVYATISALSWDNYDYNWKHNHDTGEVYEQLFAADVSQARSRGGKATLIPDA